MLIDVVHGDALDALRLMPDACVDSLVTDPPAGIGFMGKSWDHHRGGRDEWVKWMTEIMGEALRVVRPGGHGLVWALPRTSHWTASALEDAGWEIRDCVVHLQSQGFPKSRNQLKPGSEHWWLVRKPFKGSVAANVAAHGTGTLNIDGCRVQMTQHDRDVMNNMGGYGREGWTLPDGTLGSVYEGTVDGSLAPQDFHAHDQGRWPANAVLSHSDGCVPVGERAETYGGGAKGVSGFAAGYDGGQTERQVTTPVWDCEPGCPVAGVDGQSGVSVSSVRPPNESGKDQPGWRLGGREPQERGHDDSGGASRYFTVMPDPGYLYTPKAPARERPVGADGTKHPTVKSVALMRWLVRMVTPPGGTVLDCFAGSGATIEAAILEGMSCYAMEAEESYLSLIQERMDRAGYRD